MNLYNHMECWNVLKTMYWCMFTSIELILMNFENFEILWNFDIFSDIIIWRQPKQSTGKSEPPELSVWEIKVPHDILIRLLGKFHICNIQFLTDVQSWKFTHLWETLCFPYLTPTPTVWNTKSQRRVLRTPCRRPSRHATSSGASMFVPVSPCSLRLRLSSSDVPLILVRGSLSTAY